jgi:tetratricopeptide (TPR) repeat protein
MKKDNLKPIVRQYYDNEWVFVYPSSVDNKRVYDEFWEGVEFLDNEDIIAEEIFKGIILKHPYYIDAYNHLAIAYRNQKKSFESLLTAEKAYQLGKSFFPAEFNFKTDKLIWSHLDNRPFLRACQTYGLECQYHKDYSTAIEIFKENLALNEDDNQGIRYLLLEIYFETQDYNEARQLIIKHSEDYSIEFKFGIVALDIIEGNFEKADQNMIISEKTNKFFVDEIIKYKHIKPPVFRIPGEPFFDAGIPIGSIQQAYEYWSRNKKLYKTTEIVKYFKNRQKTCA